MKSPMLPDEHHEATQRALHLGRSGDPKALPELAELCRLPSNEVQRLAASAIGKLAEFGANPEKAVAVLAPLALRGRHAQTQQYAVRALKKFGAAGRAHVQDLRDMARNSANKNYVRAAAKGAADAIERADIFCRLGLLRPVGRARSHCNGYRSQILVAIFHGGENGTDARRESAVISAETKRRGSKAWRVPVRQSPLPPENWTKAEFDDAALCGLGGESRGTLRTGRRGGGKTEIEYRDGRRVGESSGLPFAGSAIRSRVGHPCGC